MIDDHAQDQKDWWPDRESVEAIARDYAVPESSTAFLEQQIYDAHGIWASRRQLPEPEYAKSDEYAEALSTFQSAVDALSKRRVRLRAARAVLPPDSGYVGAINTNNEVLDLFEGASEALERVLQLCESGKAPLSRGPKRDVARIAAAACLLRCWEALGVDLESAERKGLRRATISRSKAWYGGSNPSDAAIFVSACMEGFAPTSPGVVGDWDVQNFPEILND